MFKRIGLLLLIMTLLLSISGFSSVYAESEGDILKIGVKQEPDSLNPFVSWENASYEIFKLTYDSLTAIDRDLNTVPLLAESWDLSEDQLTWTFHLRKDVKWHDGEPFTAADVKFTYEFFQETEMGMYFGSIADIASIDVIDDYTVELHTDAPKANMLQNVTPILPMHIWKDYTADTVSDFENKEMIGTGPYKFVDWQRNQQVVFKRNDAYFGKKPNIPNLIYVIYSNNDTMVQALKNGEIDIALGLDYVDIKNVLSEKNIKNYSFEENGFTQLAFNSSEPTDLFNPLSQNKSIRHAIDYAIDKQKIVDLVYDGAAKIGSTFIPSSQTPWHYEPSTEDLRNFDPEKAIALLENEGFTEVDSDGIRSNSAGERLSFLLLSRSDNTSEVKVGQMIQSFLKDVGIELNIETVDDGVLYDRSMITKDYDMFIWGWGGDIDPTVLLNILTTSNIDNLNDVFYSNPAYDELVTKQATEMSQEKRIELVIEAQKLLYDDLPYDILYYSNNNQLVRTDLISGIVPASNGAAFYAYTNANYIDATFEGTASSRVNLPAIAVIGVVIIAGIGFLIINKQKKTKEKNTPENKEKQDW